MADQPSITAPNRKYVSPSFTSLADPFYSTIQAAINSIIDASSTNAYAIFIYPGTYNEAVTLKSYVSLAGAGIDDVIIKGTGSSQAITGPAADSGSGQSYINNLTIDGNGQSAIVYGDTAYSKNNFIMDVKIMTTVASSAIGITVGNNQALNSIGLNILTFPIIPPPPLPNPQYYIFDEGIKVTGNANLRMWQSYIITTHFCLDHNSSQYSETYNSILSSVNQSMQITSGVVNIYNSQTVGGIIVSNTGTEVKHVDSFHDGHFTAQAGATIWVSGMKWGEEAQISLLFELFNSGSKIIVSNSKAGARGGVTWMVILHDAGTVFKAFNSEFNNLGTGGTITGVSGALLYLYYCTLNKAPSNITPSSDSVFIISPNSE